MSYLTAAFIVILITCIIILLVKTKDGDAQSLLFYLVFFISVPSVLVSSLAQSSSVKPIIERNIITNVIEKPNKHLVLFLDNNEEILITDLKDSWLKDSKTINRKYTTNIYGIKVGPPEYIKE